MVKGIEVTSAIVQISGSTSETVIGTMAEERVPLTLDVLNREVLLVYAIDINSSAPTAVATANTTCKASISTTSRTTIGTIADPNVLASAIKTIRGADFADGGVGFQDVSPETPATNALEYIGILSTNDFYIQVQGYSNTSLMNCQWRMWCARARVSADIYAALVQSEALSA